MRIKPVPSALALLAAVTLGACGDDGEPAGGNLSAWCEANQVLSDVDPTAEDPQELESNVPQLRQALAQLVDSAPDDIRSASQVIADRFSEFLDEIESVGFDITEVDVDGFFGDEEIS